MKRDVQWIALPLLAALLSCGGEDENEGQDLVTPALTPDRVCSESSNPRQEGHGAECDYQAQTGCEEGLACVPVWEFGKEIEIGRCAAPCEENADCGGGGCGAMRWGRCPSGRLCTGDTYCMEAWDQCPGDIPDEASCPELFEDAFCTEL